MGINTNTVVGLSNRLAGANGLLTYVDCIGNPSEYALDTDTYAVGCYLKRNDIETGFQDVMYQMTGTTESPAWTQVGVSPIAGVVAADAAYTTVGGSGAEIIAVPGVKTGDLVLVSLLDPGSNTVVISTAPAAATDQILVTFSADPGNDAVINYLVLRAFV